MDKTLSPCQKTILKGNVVSVSICKCCFIKKEKENAVSFNPTRWHFSTETTYFTIKTTRNKANLNLKSINVPKRIIKGVLQFTTKAFYRYMLLTYKTIYEQPETVGCRLHLKALEKDCQLRLWIALISSLSRETQTYLNELCRQLWRFHIRLSCGMCYTVWKFLQARSLIWMPVSATCLTCAALANLNAVFFLIIALTYQKKMYTRGTILSCICDMSKRAWRIHYRRLRNLFESLVLYAC